ncbi:MAG TPA: saccharopine dehydrogenase NADP-binding domain-containing protein [Polyangiaceae bacterium]|nr:saccharopine dehydrogenase NADP-binding domain-containing protein [Polyangiaceae bacterium]
MSERSFLIYGANGFTGRLLAERAKERGLRPILAGRNPDDVTLLGKELGLPVRIFGLDSAPALRAGLEGVSLVLHAAGPYSKTSRPMVDACLAGSVHYLDITGEYAVLEAVLARDAEAKSRGVVLLPAVGFDVVPTDCMAKTLANALPDAKRLELAFTGGMLPSPGTAKTAVEGLSLGAKVREDGALVTLSAPRTRKIPFRSGAQFGMSIPWGDLVTAYRSTNIPDITVYTVVPRAAARGARFLKYAAPLLSKPAVTEFLKRQVEKRATGPSADQRRTARMWIWGRVENAGGTAVEGHLGVPEGYELTVLSALASAERVLRGDVPPGATTPSLAFGPDFVTTLPGVEPFELVR